MKSAWSWAITLLVGSGIGSWLYPLLRPQESSPATAKTPTVNEVGGLIHDDENRFQRLEERFDSLERIVFATAKISALEAERRLKIAEEELRESRQLFLKGLVAEGRWRQDEFTVEVLRRELQLIRTTSQQRRAVIELEIVQAEKDLQLAEDQLNYLQNLATRGFASLDQVRQNEKFVADSQARLTLARDKLKAAEELDAITTKAPAIPVDNDSNKK